MPNGKFIIKPEMEFLDIKLTKDFCSMLFTVTSAGGFIENHTLLLCPEISTKNAVPKISPLGRIGIFENLMEAGGWCGGMFVTLSVRECSYVVSCSHLLYSVST